MALHREACRNHSGARQKRSDSCPPSSLVSIRTPSFDCFRRCIHIISDRGELGLSNGIIVYVDSLCSGLAVTPQFVVAVVDGLSAASLGVLF